MTLNEVAVGEEVFVSSVFGDTKLTKRLLALGCVSGTKVLVKKIAPLGDPMLISFRGFDLSIRKKDAKNIQVVKLGDI